MTSYNPYSLTIEDLPDEVLEYILSLIPPYRDLHDCMLVSKRWRKCVINVTKVKRRNLHRAISTFDVAWHSFTPSGKFSSISKRYSHCATIHSNSMYVFGGCTSNMTTFNDLWRLDLSTRHWERPVTMGTYPTPKACSTLVCYKDFLVLFGGWTYPASYPLHQSWLLFDELHIYDIKANTWSSKHSLEAPPPTAGHSASIHGDWMVIFGGLQRPSNLVHSTKSNKVWRLNLKDWIWQKQLVKGRTAPSPRYGQSQIALDEDNLLIIGGSGGPNTNFSDIWLLNMSERQWKWLPVRVENESEAPGNTWNNPACKIGDKVIILNKIRSTSIPPLVYYAKAVWKRRNLGPNLQGSPRIDLAHRQVDKDENVNGRWGTLKNSRRNQMSLSNEQIGVSSGSSISKNKIPVCDRPSVNLAAFSTENSNVSLDRREQFERRVDNLKGSLYRVKQAEIAKVFNEPRKNMLGMYVLDISHALDENPFVTWSCGESDVFSEGRPEETILYTLVEGNSELIMFGGIQKDPNNSVATELNLSNQVSNSLHFITAPKYII